MAAFSAMGSLLDIHDTRKNNREEGTADGGEEGTIADCLIFLDVAAVVMTTMSSLFRLCLGSLIWTRLALCSTGRTVESPSCGGCPRHTEE